MGDQHNMHVIYTTDMYQSATVCFLFENVNWSVFWDGWVRWSTPVKVPVLLPGDFQLLLKSCQNIGLEVPWLNTWCSQSETSLPPTLSFNIYFESGFNRDSPRYEFYIILGSVALLLAWKCLWLMFFYVFPSFSYSAANCGDAREQKN